MFSILYQLFMLPFKILKLFIELIELLIHAFGHRGHRKRRNTTSRTSHRTRSTSNQRASVSASPSNEKLFQEHMKLLEETLKIARQTHLQPDTRLKGYKTALEICERADRYAPRDKGALESWKKLKNMIVSEQMQVMSSGSQVNPIGTPNNFSG